MNKAKKLFDENFVKDLLEREVLPLYPHFNSIRRIKIIAHKDGVWSETYHVVLEYRVCFAAPGGKRQELPIFCSAHSSEPRRNVHEALSYLWDNSFGHGYFTVPHPLFYSPHFNATFYRGVEGHTLYHYIKNKDRDTLRYMVPKAAKWFAKLHRLPAESAPAFNEVNSRIRTVVPGYERIMRRISRQYPQYLSAYERIYGILIAREEEALAKLDRKYLVHGDAHPDNIVKMGKKKIAVIDYTDICHSDFARDLGTFTQQLEYTLSRRIGDRAFTGEMLDLFLNEYLRQSRRCLDDSLKERIKTYYLWTMMRTSTHFLMKDFAQPDRAAPLLEAVKEELK